MTRSPGQSRTLPWTADELAALDSAFSIVLSAHTDDRLPSGSVEIGVVVTGDGVFVRAYRGPVSGWFQATQTLGQGTIQIDGRVVAVRFDRTTPADAPDIHDAIDRAYTAKYGSLSGGIATAQARDATVASRPRAPLIHRGHLDDHRIIDPISPGEPARATGISSEPRRSRAERSTGGEQSAEPFQMFARSLRVLDDYGTASRGPSSPLCTPTRTVASR